MNKRNVSRARIQQLRHEYAGDSVAQQQIDVYDGSTEYHRRLRSYVAAIKANDAKAEHRLERWFEKHYPDIF